VIALSKEYATVQESLNLAFSEWEEAVTESEALNTTP
jgi:hypothetical protein